jgi:hypothetical protein
MSTKRKQVPIHSVYAITTHHKNPPDAAEAWRECNVCAIGDFEEDSLTYSTFDGINQGDLILAYSCHNRIAYVGEIANGKLRRENKNIVSDDPKDDGFGYPNQKEVNWWDRPHHFSRKEKLLPGDLRNQLGKRGKTVVQIKVNGETELNATQFSKVKEMIRRVRERWSHRR